MPSYPENPLPDVPTSIAISPTTATLAQGATVQLAASITDVYGTTLSPTQTIVWSSSNPALISVDSSGLCTASSSDPTTLAVGGTVTISATYPFAGSTGPGAGTISSAAFITVTTPSAISAFVPTSPNVTLAAAQNKQNATSNGAGWKVYPASLA